MMNSEEDRWAELASMLGVGETVSTNEPSPAPEPEKKRRRRRSKKSSDAAPSEKDVAQTPTELDAAADDEAEPDLTPAKEFPQSTESDEAASKKRRRRRSRRKKVADADGGPVTAEIAGDDLQDAELVESFADWKVPTWQELIDGLHRP